MDVKKIKYYLYIYERIYNLIEEKKAKIDEYNEQMAIIEKTYASISASVNNGMPHNSSPYSDKILNQIIAKDREIENIKRLIYKETKKIDELITAHNAISKVLQESDERTKKIIKLCYFENYTTTECCYFVGCSPRTLKRIKAKVIEQIEKELDTE